MFQPRGPLFEPKKPIDITIYGGKGGAVNLKIGDGNTPVPQVSGNVTIVINDNPGNAQIAATFIAPPLMLRSGVTQITALPYSDANPNGVEMLTIPPAHASTLDIHTDVAVGQIVVVGVGGAPGQAGSDGDAVTALDGVSVREGSAYRVIVIPIGNDPTPVAATLTYKDANGNVIS